MSAARPPRLTLSIPYNGDLALIEWALQFEDVQEVYFQGPAELDLSDQYPDDPQVRDFSEEGIVKMASLCKSKGVRTNLLCNRALLFFDKLEPFFGFIEGNREVIDSVTLADPYAVRQLRQRFPDLPLQASVYMMIDTKGKARTALNLGISTICGPPSVNRRRRVLEEMMSLERHHPQFRLKLLATHACFDSCVFYNRHALVPQLRDALHRGGDVFSDAMGSHCEPDACVYPLTDLSDLIKRPFIRPDDVGYYQEHQLAHELKIAFRNESTDALKTKVAAYVARSFTGDLFKMMNLARRRDVICHNERIPEDFARVVVECNDDHESCDYCTDVVRRSFGTRSDPRSRDQPSHRRLELVSGAARVLVVLDEHRPDKPSFTHSGTIAAHLARETDGRGPVHPQVRSMLKVFGECLDRLVEELAPESADAAFAVLSSLEAPVRFTVRGSSGRVVREMWIRGVEAIRLADPR